MTLKELNALGLEERTAKFQECCNASQWYTPLAAAAPFDSLEKLLAKADVIWANCTEQDWLEAFEAHPKIGDVTSLAKKFAATKEWAGNEQSEVDNAAAETIAALAKGNQEYEEKFGFIFIVCATGKTAQEMLDLLLERLPNERQQELKIAAAEQHKITKIRINKLLA